jgi:CheY-like chemotaxis protein
VLRAPSPQTSVLLVDDDAANRLVLAALLEDEGFRVDVAGSFAAASLKLSAGGARYDLVLLDEDLGDGRGTDLVPRVRARLPGARVVLVSGAAEEGGARARFDAVLAKGAGFPELLAELQRLL